MSDAGKKIIEGLKEGLAGDFARVHIPDGTGGLQTWVRETPLTRASADLLEQLQQCVLQLEYLHGKFQKTGSGEAAIARARAAIAKATGRAE
jgi:hypothetical protein